MAADLLTRTMIEVSILIFSAKLLAEVFHRLDIPVVLGELTAGIIVGPYALGGLVVLGNPLVEILEPVRILGEIGAIIILFVAGLEMTPREFLRAGLPSFTVGILGVIAPFGLGFYAFLFLGFDAVTSAMVGVSLAATSIAITVKALDEMNKLHTKEARLILGAAVVDDVLAIALLAVVTSIGVGGATPGLQDVVVLIGSILLLFFVLLGVASYVVPRLVDLPSLWRAEGTVEAIATAVFFGVAALAAFLGLSPIVGAFIVGMALAQSQIIGRIEDYTEKLMFIFAPLFFGVVGAQVDLTGVSLNSLYLVFIAVVIAFVSKMFACGLPSALFLKGEGKWTRVGVGMIPRGEVGLIVAGVGVTEGILVGDVYTAIILMVAITTLSLPLLLRRFFGSEEAAEGDEPPSSSSRSAHG